MQNFHSFITSHKIFSAFILLLSIVLIWQISLTPSNTKNWRSGNENLPTFSVEENILTIKNFRDFYFLEDKNLTEIKNWDTKTFNLNEIEGMDFIISHFADFHGIAHSFVTFRFADGKNFSISMEARMETGVKYSPFTGLFNQFEMLYIVGSERDLIGSRIGYRNEEVYLYKTTADKQMSKKILLSFMTDINDIEKNPRFYNTLWRNCTTEIVTQIERVLEKNIWWSYEHLLPGYADKKALEMNFLANPQNFSFEEFEQNSKISDKKIEQWEENFSRKIRVK